MDIPTKAEAAVARRAEWQRIITEQEASGLKAAAFCRQRGLPTWKFSYWRKVLSGSRGEPARAEGFMEVRARRAAGGIWVESGVWRVRVEPGFDPATLRRVLEALAAP